MIWLSWLAGWTLTLLIWALATLGALVSLLLLVSLTLDAWLRRRDPDPHRSYFRLGPSQEPLGRGDTTALSCSRDRQP